MTLHPLASLVVLISFWPRFWVLHEIISNPQEDFVEGYQILDAVLIEWNSILREGRQGRVSWILICRTITSVGISSTFL